MTIGTLAVCIGLFLGVHLDGSKDAASHWGYRSAFALWSDNLSSNYAVWSLITSAFVHQHLWHIGLNAYWLWKLGSVVEPVMGRRPEPSPHFSGDHADLLVP